MEIKNQDVEERLVPLKAAEAEIKILNSRFLARLFPVSTVEEARACQKAERALWPDATHHVPAFVIGHGRSVISHCSDDGEPSGTAGRPALAVLEGSGLGNLAVVVTRWFGGTKLGTGGLVQAYGDAVKAVLAVTTVGKLVETSVIALEMPYRSYDSVMRDLQTYQAQIEQSEFGVEVKLVARVLSADLPDIERKLQELSAGQLVPVELSRDMNTPFPLD